MSDSHTNGSGARRVDRGRAYRVLENGEVEVHDLDLSAYLSMRNVPLASAERYGREFLFRFHDPDNRIPQLTVEYVNSESARFADAQRRLRKVIISRPRNKPWQGSPSEKS
jgi:hypothetical protein